MKGLTYFIYYGVGHMVKDHSANEEVRCRHCRDYFFNLAAKEFLYVLSPRHDSTLVVDHWLEREIAE